MCIALDFHNDVVDDCVDGVETRNERTQDTRQGGRHRCAHDKERLRNDRKSTLPQVWHVTCVAILS